MTLTRPPALNRAIAERHAGDASQRWTVLTWPPLRQDGAPSRARGPDRPAPATDVLLSRTEACRLPQAPVPHGRAGAGPGAFPARSPHRRDRREQRIASTTTHSGPVRRGAGLPGRRDAQAAELTRRLARNHASQKGLIAELAQLGSDSTPATTAYRARIREHYTELHDTAAALQAQLDAITAQAATGNDPALIAELPYAPGFLATAPDPVKENLYAALGIQCLYRPGKNS